MYKEAFDREKDLTDRALKLAETSKPKTMEWWYIIPIVGAACLLIGSLL